MKNLSQSSQYPGLDLNLLLREYETGVLTTTSDDMAIRLVYNIKLKLLIAQILCYLTSEET
jgi:hypothetical protein